jgi:hypothetical protein
MSDLEVDEVRIPVRAGLDTPSFHTAGRDAIGAASLGGVAKGCVRDGGHGPDREPG